jgi:hypothetical protein
MLSRKVRLALLLLALSALTCSEGGQLPSPTILVDLSDRLPDKTRRQLAAADTGWECRRKVTLEGHGARQRFVVTWRLFQAEAGKRFITALRVEPDGAFEGGRGPRASASVRETRGSTVPVEIRWSATKGCSAIKASTTVELRTDDPTCSPPKPAGKIFK